MTLLHDFMFAPGLGALLVLFITYVIGRAIYNVTLHPLARFPGPLSRTAFALPGLWNTCKGNYVSDVWAAHQKYGEVVRIAPDALSFSSAAAWNDIYSLRNGKSQLAKDYKRFPDRPEAIHLFGSNDEDHARIRKIISYGFTGSAVRRQQGLVDGHIATLIEELTQSAGSKIDLNHWFNVFTFDVMSHLTFGESFNSLPSGKLHPFTVDFFGKMKIFPIIYVSREYYLVNLLMKLMMMVPSIKREQEEFFEATKARVDKRMGQNVPDLHDIMKYILENNHEKGMTKEEIEGTTTVLLNAGGQETATCLVSTVFYLLKHPDMLLKARESALADDSIYIDAAITEALRVHPPVSGNIQRRTGSAGHVINGQFVPPNTSVGVSQFAACHSPLNFTKPESFIVARWLANGPKEFEKDNKGAYQPFSVGPRNCIGKSLALMVASRALTQLLKQFEIELCRESNKWDEGQKFDVGWDRPPLYVVLKRRM
ncbi:putative benzoate 4-monooxygenase cytochrome P450 [Xylariaceae sp. AK1471]|nr:putative benzoate 4-monooxygenase cytochrome P450 [Xylariaceae sp. AK1471]